MSHLSGLGDILFFSHTSVCPILLKTLEGEEENPIDFHLFDFF